MLGGERGDVPLEPGAGGLIADLVVDSEISAVVDVSGFRKAERKTFVTAFVEQLFHRKKRAPSPVHVILEEAQLFAPQHAPAGDARMLGAMEDLVRLGRNYGVGCTLITQRPQSVHKSVLSQVEALIVLQVNGAHERKAIEAWVVDQGIDVREMVKELPGLPVGTAFFWSPQWLGVLKKVRIRKKWTLDASATPKVGQKALNPRKLKAIEVDQLRESMAEVVQRAEENDPAKLRRRIAALERELRQAQRLAPAADPGALDRARAEGARVAGRQVSQVVAQVQSRDRQAVAALERVLIDSQKALDVLRTPIDVDMTVAEGHRTRQRVESRTSATVSTPMRREAGRKRGAGSVLGNMAGRLTGSPPPTGQETEVSRPQQRILDALAWLESVGIEAPDRKQLALWCDVSPTSGGYFNNLGALRSAGLVDYPAGGTVALTEEGRRAAQPPAATPTVDEMQESACRKVGNAKAKILRAVIAVYPEAISRDELAEMIEVSPTSGGYFNNLGSLRTLGLIDYPAPGSVRATSILFLE